MSLVGDGGGEEELWHVRSGGCSVTHVPSGGWWRRGGSLGWGTLSDTWSLACTQWGTLSESLVWDGRGGALPCTQWGTLSDTCPQWGMGEERRISAMYAVGASGGWWRRGGALACTQWGMLSDTCP